jgi:uncharacterized protein
MTTAPLEAVSLIARPECVGHLIGHRVIEYCQLSTACGCSERSEPLASTQSSRSRKQVKRVKIPLTVRPYQVTAIPGRGLGLTACSDIDPRTKIDDCFTWELPRRDIKHVTETVLNGNYFDHPVCSTRGLVAIGHISLINHDPEPNCEWRMLQVHDRWMIEVWSLRRLSCGEELTFDYGYDPTVNA